MKNTFFLLILSYVLSGHFSYISTLWNTNLIGSMTNIRCIPSFQSTPSSLVRNNNTFAGVRISPMLINTLSTLGITEPTPIQLASVASLVSGLSCILHAETGSGKTLSYLLPILKRITDDPTNILPLQALIVVPTKELAIQIATDIAILTGIDASGTSEISKKKSVVELFISSSDSTGLDYLERPIVVGTPHKLFTKLQDTKFPRKVLKNLEYIVLDEVDRIIPAASRYATLGLKKAMNSQSNPTVDLIKFIINYKKTKPYVYSDQTDAEAIRGGGSSAMQVVAVSATVGRPLRRELYRLFHGEAESSSSNGYGGEFYVIRPQSNQIETAVDMEKTETGMSRKIGIPREITHLVIVNDDFKEDLPNRLGIIKEQWIQFTEMNSTVDRNPANKMKIVKEDVIRGLLFVPNADVVKDTVGLMKFWGLDEIQNLQKSLGLESHVRPYVRKEDQKDGGKREDGGFMNENKPARQSISMRKMNIINKALDKFEYDKDDKVIPMQTVVSAAKKDASTEDMIHYAKRSRIGTSCKTVPLDSDQALSHQVTVQNELFVAPFSGTRGLHIQDIKYVFVPFPPSTMDEYLHIAGRTGRIGNKDPRGTVVVLATLNELKKLQSWQTALGIEFKVQYV